MLENMFKVLEFVLKEPMGPENQQETTYFADPGGGAEPP